MSLDPVTLAERLINCPSVTPATGAVFDCLAEMLEPLGFAIHRFVAGEAPDGPVENLLAIRQGPEKCRHFAFAGHLDVVPPGEGWSSGPFEAERRGELLFGRGAVDMKGSIASMVAAVAEIPADSGTLSFIITGDEEGPARFGTLPLIDLIRELGVTPDLCLVGEPTSVDRLGDMVKIGRRGSVNMWITCKGAQGHVAYPHLADNPIPRLVALLAELDAVKLDEGTEWFQPSNLEVTDLEVGNRATNVIPAEAKARISIRFNDLHSGASLVAMVEEVARRYRGEVRAVISGESFITLPGSFSTIIAEAVKAETGLDPELSTSGGTSDARFLRAVCPVVEFGLCNATMHKKDEAVAMEDLRVLQRIYKRIAISALS